MSFTTAATRIDDVLEQDFLLRPDDRPIPGVYREPAGGAADRLVLLGHGGTTDKRADYVMHVSQLLAARGIASMVIDGPGHGERATFEFTGRPAEFDEAWVGGGGTAGVLTDWRLALDFIEAERGVRPTGWWGLSMGTMMGLPVVANDDRFRCAVLGLMGVQGPNGGDLREMAPKVTCPVRFLMQWDDEIVPRDNCLELFDLLGTTKKTLHANPGIHVAVPNFEYVGSADYLDRYLR